MQFTVGKLWISAVLNKISGHQGNIDIESLDAQERILRSNDTELRVVWKDMSLQLWKQGQQIKSENWLQFFDMSNKVRIPLGIIEFWNSLEGLKEI
jgi:hypothetical protein